VGHKYGVADLMDGVVERDEVGTLAPKRQLQPLLKLDVTAVLASQDPDRPTGAQEGARA